MSKKIFLLLGIGILFLSGCSLFNNDNNQEIVDNKLQVDISGYIKTCTNIVKISKKENGEWNEVSNILPIEGHYYLYEDFVGTKKCEKKVCEMIEGPIEVELVEYTETGKRESHERERYEVTTYGSNPLSSEIMVEVDYFSDDGCKEAQKFETTVKI